MINKQKLWFLTLFSLILVLSIYYITMPEDVLKDIKTETVSKETKNNKATIDVEESEALTALRIESDEKVIKEMNALQEILLDKKSTTEDKNNAYESLKDLNLNKGKEENLEKLVKNELKLKTFIKINKDQIKVVVDEKKHDAKIANQIIRLIQKEFDNQMYITVKFQS